ncbi:PDGLE domain-containing protein [Leifsonia sp. Leaf264]|uniref:PDGLE domain-containing protein n=1 Tax=Leifsonia sp. Leaf264 TaxID=1736314 RepID=UPI000ABE71B7|nr:PDGLE domain-containing protein [Leifsonia sp. Leaf264]
MMTNRTPPSKTSRHRVSTRVFTVVAVVASLLIACVVSIWASTLPDGLESVAGSTGFLASAQASAAAGSPFAGYSFLGIADPTLSVALAGAVGCAFTFGLAMLVGRIARRRSTDD